MPTAASVLRAQLVLLGRRRPELLSATVVAAVAGAVVLVYRSCGARHDVERFYHRQHRPLYYVIQMCNAVLMAALVFNGRFVVLELLAALVTLASRAWTA
jgi:hypothetical protein